jgi:hypothetical protein
MDKSLVKKSRRRGVPSKKEEPTVAPVIGINGSGSVPIDSESRRAMIAERAYYLAEQRRFEPGHELDDWLLAEREVERV